MSIPVRFDWYDVHGDLLAANRGCFTISYGEDPTNLTTLITRMAEGGIQEHQKFIHPDVKYAVPLRVPDYMFDLEDLTHPWPNKFKQNYTQEP
jgi:hypothetical protein